MRLMKLFKNVFLAMCAAFLLALTACTGGASTQGGGTHTLRMAAGATGPFTSQFNPFLQASASSSGYSSLVIYEPLMLVDYVKDTTKPWLAQKATWNKDGTQLTIDLRQGVKWSDGSAFTADDVAFTFELMTKFKALNFNGLPIKSATTASPTQAVVTFTEPAFQTLWYTTEPVQKKQWSTVSDPVTYANPQPVGTGPFTLKSFTPQVITLQKNPSYWDSGKPAVDSVQYLSYDSESSMVAAMQGGQVDWIVSSNTDPKQVTQHSPSTLASWASTFGVSIYLLPNATTAPTNDTAVRKAISQAIDRPNLAKLAFGPGAQPVQSPTGLDGAGASEMISDQFKALSLGGGDSSAAKQTLQAAGYTLGSDGYFVSPEGKQLALTLTVPTTNPYGDWVRAGTLMTESLKGAGIKLTLKPESQQSWRSDVALGNFQLSMRAAGGAGSLYDNLSRLVSQPVTAVGKQAVVNWERFASPTAGQLLTTMASSDSSTPAFKQALDGLQSVFVDDVPVIPLGNPSAAGVWRTDSFSGWPSDHDPYGLPTANKPSVVDILGRLTPAHR
ncbi:ABC transporter substrate-binding protein [Sinomonas sp. G460-2]|uniref:ABC transporter substrate-binding protein n=1 Tax=Sinomonas sp. G460-2 TaxID=3393464 RepID=UPI0039F14CE1